MRVFPLFHSQYFRETILNEIRKARELYTGPELAAELGRIQQRLDNVECLSADIVINLLLSYRDIQVGGNVPLFIRQLVKEPFFFVFEIPIRSPLLPSTPFILFNLSHKPEFTSHKLFFSPVYYTTLHRFQV